MKTLQELKTQYPLGCMECDGETTYEHLEQRIQYCYERANPNSPNNRGRWDDTYGAVALYLEGIIADMEEDQVENVDENEHHYMLEDLLEDHGYADIYENGWYKDGRIDSMYSWYLRAYAGDLNWQNNFMKEWCIKVGAEYPKWLVAELAETKKWYEDRNEDIPEHVQVDIDHAAL